MMSLLYICPYTGVIANRLDVLLTDHPVPSDVIGAATCATKNTLLGIFPGRSRVAYSSNLAVLGWFPRTARVAKKTLAPKMAPLI
jgi:hypothetical protein